LDSEIFNTAEMSDIVIQDYQKSSNVSEIQRFFGRNSRYFYTSSLLQCRLT